MDILDCLSCRHVRNHYDNFNIFSLYQNYSFVRLNLLKRFQITVHHFWRLARMVRLTFG